MITSFGSHAMTANRLKLNFNDVLKIRALVAERMVGINVRKNRDAITLGQLADAFSVVEAQNQRVNQVHMTMATKKSLDLKSHIWGACVVINDTMVDNTLRLEPDCGERVSYFNGCVVFGVTGVG